MQLVSGVAAIVCCERNPLHATSIHCDSCRCNMFIWAEAPATISWDSSTPAPLYPAAAAPPTPSRFTMLSLVACIIDRDSAQLIRFAPGANFRDSPRKPVIVEVIECIATRSANCCLLRVLPSAGTADGKLPMRQNSNPTQHLAEAQGGILSVQANVRAQGTCQGDN